MRIKLRSALDIAGVVTCQDGVKRVAAAGFGKTEKGWVLTRFNLSINGFSKQVIEDDYINEVADIVIPTSHKNPRYTAGIVTRPMMKNVGIKDNSALAISFYDFKGPNYEDPLFDKGFGGHFYPKVENNSFLLTCDRKPIVLFSVRPNK